MSVFQLHPPVYALAARRVIGCQFGIFASTKSTLLFFVWRRKVIGISSFTIVYNEFPQTSGGQAHLIQWLVELSFLACFSEHVDMLGGTCNWKGSISLLTTLLH